MHPERMGVAFPTRLSFMRSLIRRMNRERWRIECKELALDNDGYGHAIYTARGRDRAYSLVAFSHALEEDQRTDRVIAEAWDASFVLFDGIPDAADIDRLSEQTPRQEGGRFQASEIILSRANRSVRLFDHVRDALAAGKQPDMNRIAEVGYLMRTTAVYGNGKFGVCDRERIAGRPEFAGPFQAEMLTVYLIRCFTHDHVEYVAHRLSAETFQPMAPAAKRFLGIGNATGLGMAPFLITHPELIHLWTRARETALNRVRAVSKADAEVCHRCHELLHRARRHVSDWQVQDRAQQQRISALSRDLCRLSEWIVGTSRPLHQPYPWDGVYRWAGAECSLECQELVLSLLLELYPHEVDPLEDELSTTLNIGIDGSMSVGELKAVIEESYGWALEIDFKQAASNAYFWYYSEDKMEPRLGQRAAEAGADNEMPIAVARDVERLYRCLSEFPTATPIATLLLNHPSHRHVVKRVQTIMQYPYGEVQSNLIGVCCRPIDLLRWKLAYFGASKFDPKSDLWTRITLYQGAPLPFELHGSDADDWCFPIRPQEI